MADYMRRKTLIQRLVKAGIWKDCNAGPNVLFGEIMIATDVRHSLRQVCYALRNSLWECV